MYFEKTKGKFVISYTSPNATLGPYRANNYLYNYFEITIESTRKWLWFSFSSIRDWSRYLAPPSEPIRYKTKTNDNSVNLVFPSFQRLHLFSLAVVITLVLLLRKAGVDRIYFNMQECNLWKIHAISFVESLCSRKGDNFKTQKN